MPLVEISAVKDVFSEKERVNIAGRITKLVIESEGLEYKPLSKGVALIEFREFENFYIGGENINKDNVIIKIYTFENAFSDEVSKKLHADIVRVVSEENEKTGLKKGNNVWCINMPLACGDFSVGGNTMTIDIAKKFVASYVEK